MAVSYKPAGYNSASVYIVAKGAQRLIDFLERALNATALRRYERPDGTIMHAEMRVDDTVLMVADASEQFPPIPGYVHIYVPDVDAAYARALAAGGESVQVPSQREGDPDKRGGVKDPTGSTWWLSTQVEAG